MSQAIRENSVVSLVYTLKDTNGAVLEERTPENPHEYIQGGGQILHAIEQRLFGKTPGFRVSLSLDAADAFGVYDPKLLAELSPQHFPSTMELTVGMKFNTLGPDGKPTVVRITELDDEVVMVDGNHPLAGVDVIFEILIQDVRSATEAELKAGVVLGLSERSDLH